MNRISALLWREESLLPLFALHHVKIWEDSCLQTRKRTFSRHRLTGTWSWTFHPPELWEINICCLRQLTVWYFGYNSPHQLRQYPYCKQERIRRPQNCLLESFSSFLMPLTLTVLKLESFHILSLSFL